MNDLKITVLGISPLDVEGEEHIQVGKELVALTRETKLTWRRGKRPIVQFVGDPLNSYFYKAQDGLFYPAGLYDRNGEGVALEDLNSLVRQLRFAP